MLWQDRRPVGDSVSAMTTMEDRKVPYLSCLLFQHEQLVDRTLDIRLDRESARNSINHADG